MFLIWPENVTDLRVSIRQFQLFPLFRQKSLFVRRGCQTIDEAHDSYPLPRPKNEYILISFATYTNDLSHFKEWSALNDVNYEAHCSWPWRLKAHK